MSKELEIEFKNLLTKDEFERIKHNFKITCNSFHTQTNHYFDTATFALKNLKCSLRIREKSLRYELTLKVPVKDGMLETNQVLQKSVAKNMLEAGIVPDGAVKQSLNELDSSIHKLVFFGALTTKRAVHSFEGGTLMLDNSVYLNKEDFELEYEVSDKEIGKVIFNELLHSLHIPIRKAVSKPQRFWAEKYQS